jgi:hypothetical protein
MKYRGSATTRMIWGWNSFFKVTVTWVVTVTLFTNSLHSANPVIARRAAS